MSIPLWGWTDRSQVERVRLYTIGSLYVIFWFLLLVMSVSAYAVVNDYPDVAGMAACTLALGVTGTFAMREAIRLYPEHGPLPWLQLGVLVAVVAVAEALVFLLPERGQFSAALVVLGALAWGAGGFRERRVQWFLYVACPLLVLLPTGEPGFALIGLGTVLFLIFTVQSSLWLLGVVTQLERSRTTQAALAVAEERLRFSHDVHDVLGRQLSTIAVQAELAATLAERGDARAPQHILHVRETAHEALREARELARGYRPLDLHAEIDGAVSLLRSAGISATADLDDLPVAWHEPVARVIREAVTNVLRHSSATHVQMSYADQVVLIVNDGATETVKEHLPTGTGLLGLVEQLAPSGAAITNTHQGDDFVVRVELASVPAPRVPTAPTTPTAPGVDL